MLDALQADLHKSHFEGYMCELGLNLDELGYLARHVAEWSRPRRRPTPLAQFKSKSYELAEPYGVVLVMSPWNYPYLLSLDPSSARWPRATAWFSSPAPTPPTPAGPWPSSSPLSLTPTG